jgi:DNA helicase HerA-like ATPase
VTGEASRIGKVLDVDGSAVTVEINRDIPSGLIFIHGEPHSVGQVGSFVRFPLGFTNLVGVVTRAGANSTASKPANADEAWARWITVQLVGEATPGLPFSRGVARLPTVGETAHVVTKSDLEALYGNQDETSGWFSVGRVAAAESIDARINVNRLVTRHSAVVGSTGSGKSTAVARIVESVTDPTRYPSARVVVFDLHGEYLRSFEDRGTALKVSLASSSSSLYVPFWALSFEELVPMTFGSLPDEAGRAHIRDEIVRLKRAALAIHPIAGILDADVTVDTPVPFSLNQLWYDVHVYLNATHTAAGTAQSRSTWALELDAGGVPLDIGSADDVRPPKFLPQDQSAGAVKVFLSMAPLNIRRNVDVLASRLRDRRWGFILSPGPWAPDVTGKVDKDLDNLLKGWLDVAQNPLIVDLSGAPQVVIPDVIGSMTRLIYDALYWSRKLSEGGRERPVLLVFEEAHRYLSGAGAHAARESIQRIVREGRKYGVGAMIVSQRPSEIDETILSQCGSLLALRLANPNDRSIVARSAADSLEGMFALLPILRTGEALMVGEFVNFPTRTRLHLPSKNPDSFDPVLAGDSERPGGWDKELEVSDFKAVTTAWRNQTIDSAEVKRAP